MNAQKSIKITILLFYCALCVRDISAHGGYRRPFERKLSDLSSESSEEDSNAGHLQVHPWERHRFRHRHGHVYRNDLDFLNVLATNRDSENQDGNTPTYTFSHSTTRLHMPRLKVILGAETAEQEPSHPWHLHEPHKRHRFHHHRWHAGLFHQDNDDFSLEDIQTGSGNGAGRRGHIANSNNNCNDKREWESVESLESNGGSKNEEETTQKTAASTTTTISPITQKIMTSTEKSTTNIPTIYETTTRAIYPAATDVTTTTEPMETTYAIDIRGGF